MNEPRTIKKYPNRRLYDTVESRYITLADIRRLVMEKIDFIVIDKKSQEDITRSILLQVISEQEHSGDPLMSQDFLSQIIRSYGGAMQSFVGSYLEQSLKTFVSQQQQAGERMREAMGPDPLSTIASITQKNYEIWRTFQDDFFRALGGGSSSNAPRQREPEPEPDDTEDADAPPRKTP
jgi:polyhydroxyalkanoate synthesis repressor PhaR